MCIYITKTLRTHIYLLNNVYIYITKTLRKHIYLLNNVYIDNYSSKY